MIIRGTTPYHNFILPILKKDIQKVQITYMQNDTVILEKTDNDIVIDNIIDLYENASVEELEELSEEERDSCQLTVHLTQEDTLAFEFFPAAKKNIAVIQIRILTTDGEAYASNPVTERIFGVLHEGVLGDE